MLLFDSCSNFCIKFQLPATTGEAIEAYIYIYIYISSDNYSLTCGQRPKFSHAGDATPILKSLHWLKINQRIEYKILSLTYKVLTTAQPGYLRNLISVDSPHIETRYSSSVTVSRPSSSSSLKSLTAHFVMHLAFGINNSCLIPLT